MEDCSSWTSCEMYGHRYENDEERPNHWWCRDCGETYDDDPSDSESEGGE